MACCRSFFRQAPGQRVRRIGPVGPKDTAWRAWSPSPFRRAEE